MSKFDGVVRMTKPWMNRHGWDLTRFPGRSYGHRRALLLSHLGCDVVLDVGANTGQFAAEVRTFGYVGDIYSFEPTQEAFSALSQHASNDSRWTAIRTAIGDAPGVLTMHISGNSVSSSALQMLDRHAEAEPSSVFIRDEVVPIAKLDSLVEDFDIGSSNLWLKIDTQGYEESVVQGATDVLTRCSAVEMELSLVPLYEGQMLFLDCVRRMESLGFRLASLESQFWDEGTGETLQADGIFVRASS